MEPHQPQLFLQQLFSNPVMSHMIPAQYVSIYFLKTYFILGHAVAQLVEALRYKSEGRAFDSRWCHWNFSLT